MVSEGLEGRKLKIQFRLDLMERSGCRWSNVREYDGGVEDGKVGEKLEVRGVQIMGSASSKTAGNHVVVALGQANRVTQIPVSGSCTVGLSSDFKQTGIRGLGKALLHI